MMKVLCVLGRYQYGDERRGCGTEYGAFVPALKALGHQVVHFENRDATCCRNYADLNRALSNVVERERPDVMLVVQRDYEIWTETLQIIRARGDVATVCWCTDDSWQYREVSRFIGAAYHAVATTYPPAITRYHREDIRQVLVTQWAASSEWLRPPLPASVCRYPVSFVGTAHGNRRATVARLRACGIEVCCFGYGWESGPVAFHEIPEITQQSVISLNFANSKGVNQVKARTFEVPGAGGFLLTEAAPGLETHYQLGQEIAVYEGIRDLVAKVRHYLAHPEERDGIAVAGFERTRGEHTYERRMSELIDYALSARDEWRRDHPRPVVPHLEAAIRRHRCSRPLSLARGCLLLVGCGLWGRERGPRAARRLAFEISWRLAGGKTYTAAGWPGRMFPSS